MGIRAWISLLRLTAWSRKMSGEHSPESPVDPADEENEDKSKNNDGKAEEEKQDESSGAKGKKKKNQNDDGDDTYSSNDEMSYCEWKVWKKEQKLKSKKKKKSSSKILIDSSDDSDSDRKKRSFRTSSKSSSLKEKKKVEYNRVSHDYTFQLPSDLCASIHMGKPPFFNGTGYNQWKTKMFHYLNAVHEDLWKVVEVGCEITDEDETPTPLQQYVLQRNFQALNTLHAS
jgi:cobalamin biosynthesis protein CobT